MRFLFSVFVTTFLISNFAFAAFQSAGTNEDQRFISIVMDQGRNNSGQIVDGFRDKAAFVRQYVQTNDTVPYLINGQEVHLPLGLFVAQKVANAHILSWMESSLGADIASILFNFTPKGTPYILPFFQKTGRIRANVFLVGEHMSPAYYEAVLQYLEREEIIASAEKYRHLDPTRGFLEMELDAGNLSRKVSEDDSFLGSATRVFNRAVIAGSEFDF